MAEGETPAFQRSVTMIALVSFILMMCLVGYLIMQARKNQVYPPNVPSCPDYYEMSGPGKCNNVKGLGNNHPNPADFTAEKYKGIKGRIEKCKWSKKYGVTWDGITDRNLC